MKVGGAGAGFPYIGWLTWMFGFKLEKLPNSFFLGLDALGGYSEVSSCSDLISDFFLYLDPLLGVVSLGLGYL